MRHATLRTIGLAFLVALFLPAAGIAQPTVDGVLTDAEYVPIGGNIDGADGFGPGSDVDSLLVYADDTEQALYIAAVGNLSGNGLGIMLNVGGSGAPTGAPSGTDLGVSGPTGYHYLTGDGGSNLAFRADFEVDVATAVNDGGTAFLADYTGMSPTVDSVKNVSGIETALVNTDSDTSGVEWKIPFSALGSNVDSANDFELFAFVVSGTAFFSDETIPGDGTQIGGNPGFNAKFNELPGRPYHDRSGNQPPIAVTDTFAATAGKTLSVSAPGVLGNDKDPEQDSLTAALVDDVSNGTLTLNDNGSLEYTPNAGFSGTDSFTYEATDGAGNADTATVAIESNQLPTASADSFTARSGRTLSVSAPGVLGNDSDPEDGSLTASAVVSNVSNGSLTLNSDGSFEYTSTSGFTGTDSFSYEITDQAGGTDTASVDIGVVSSDAFIVDGQIDDPNYQLLGSAADPANGFGSGNDLDSLYVYADDASSTLYIAAGGVLSGNGLGIMLNVTGSGAPSGAPAGTDLGVEGTTDHLYLSADDNGFNVDGGDFQADFEVDVATAISESGIAHLADYTASGGATVDSVKNIAGVEAVIENTDTTTTGVEWKIPYSAVGASASSEFEVFGVIVSNDGYFSNETIPGDATQIASNLTDGGGNPGYNAQWDEYPGGPYHDKLGNQPPVAIADTFTAADGDSLGVESPGILFNDGDPDGDSVSVTTPPVSDVSSGTLTLEESGAFGYEPNGSTDDSFTYEITAGGEADTATVTLNVLPSAPTDVSASLTGDSIQVSWSASASGNVDSYRIYRNTPGSSPAEIDVVSASTTSYVDNTVSAGSTYVYGITAVDVEQDETSPVTDQVVFDEVPSASVVSTVSADGTVDFGGTGTSLAFSGVNGSGDVTVNRFGSAPGDSSSIGAANVSDYRITVDAGGDLSFDSTTVKFAVSSLGGVTNPSSVTIFTRSSVGTGSFSALPTMADSNGTPNDISDDTLKATVTSFSEFAFGSDSDPLPVELARFEGTTAENGIQLSWRTASEQNNAGFRIQRRVEDVGSATWTKVHFVESKAAGGTSSEGHGYQFTDESVPFAADSVSYRLKQVDVDGAATVGDPITVTRTVEALQLKAPYPNPVRTRLSVPFAVPEGTDGADVQIRLYDILGRRVETVKASAEPGRHKHTLEVDDLASGVYFLRLQSGETAETRKVTIIR